VSRSTGLRLSQATAFSRPIPLILRSLARASARTASGSSRKPTAQWRPSCCPTST